MTARTSDTAVRLVLSTSLTTGQVEAFIADASLWVDEELGDSGLTAGRLELIERYLACALIRMRDLGLTSAKFDDISEQYQVDPQVTEYLTRAANFDTTGTLRATFITPVEEGKAVQWRTGAGYVEEAQQSEEE